MLEIEVMDFAQHLKSSVDIVKVVGEYVRLRKVGATSRYMGLCPFHTEKTPSFSVDGARQFYYCFGCQAGGDVLKFVMELERISFFEALTQLAEHYGIPMPKRQEYSDSETKLRGSIQEMHDLAARVYCNNLASSAGAEALEYVTRRGVSRETVEEFGVGFSERSGQALTRRFEKEGIPHEQMEASGLVMRRQDGSGWFDRFRGRLMFPIHNETGKIIAFAGRALAAGDEPKYMNSPETPIYRKSTVLYNMHRAKDAIRRRDRAILVEGYMDVIGVYASGVREVVASCGTALTSLQVKALRRHSDKIVVNFDPDAAGANAAERSIQILLDEGMHVRIMELMDGLDPDEFIGKYGAAAYAGRAEKAGTYFHWLADRARQKFEMQSADGRMDALKFLLPAIQRIGDKLERAAIASDVAAYLGVDTGLVLEQFRKAAADRRDAPVIAPVLPPVSDAERTLLKSFLSSEENRRAAIPVLAETGAVEHLPTGRILQAIFTLSANGSSFDYSELDARLAEQDRSLLRSTVLTDNLSKQEYSLEETMSCVASLQAMDRESRRAAIKARVKAAERSGNMSEALQLMDDLRRLETN